MTRERYEAERATIDRFARLMAKDMRKQDYSSACTNARLALDRAKELLALLDVVVEELYREEE